jgi:hypothetical protein
MLGAACAQQQRPMYHWGDYDSRLYKHYRNPQDREAWVASMQAVVLAAEREGRKVPPGVYAEYGYALYEQGNHAAAITYFEKERDLWPESRAFMEKMIQNAQRQQAQRSASPRSALAPPAAVEEGTP